MARKPRPKQKSRKRAEWIIWENDRWAVTTGRLVPPPGRPRKVKSLFRHVAEKIPFESLNDVWREFREHDWDMNGVYIAHDSMGFARYVGRGHVFRRLLARRKAAPLELSYFSFYIMTNKTHEREVETLMIRLGGPHLHFNAQKKRVDIAAGNIRDYEAGTRFVERRRRRTRAAR